MTANSKWPSIPDAVVAQIKDELMNTGESQEVIADRHGLSRNQVKRIITKYKIARTVNVTGHTAQLDASEGTAKRLDAAAQISRLHAEIKKLHRERLDDDAMTEILQSTADTQVPSPKWLIETPAKKSGGGTPEVPVLSLADWHLGEVVSLAETGDYNVYNVAIAEARVKEVLAAALHLCRNHGPGLYPGIVLNLLGDFVSGGLHPELLKTDELEILPSVLKALELLSEVIRTLADEFGFVYVPCVCGNHGRMTMKPEFKRYIYKNADWLIYKLLKRDFKNDKRVTFSVPASNDAHYRVWGKRILAVHGDMLGVKGGDGIIGAIGPILRGEIKTRNQSATMGKDYDLLIMGHWHQELKLPRAIVSNCLIGFNEYAMKVLRAAPTPPSQPLFFLHPWRGISSYWNIGVGQKRTLLNAEPWVSFPAPGSDE